MDIKSKEIIDFEFDQDLLNQFFEKLSLESNIPDLTDSLDILNIECKNCEVTENNRAVSTEDCISSEPIEIGLNDTLDSDLKTLIKTENGESLNNLKEPKPVSLSDFKVPSELWKETEEDNKNSFIKTELFTSSSDDEEDTESLLLRGGPDKTQKRSHKTKNKAPYEVSSVGIDPHKLLHCNSGIIIKNNCNHIQANYLQNNYGVEPLLSPECLNICSPESGYDTSQSSVNSPSPPVEGSFVPQLVDEDHETAEKRAVKEIFNSLLEEEKLFFMKNTKLKISDTNDNIVSKLGDQFAHVQNSLRYVGSINLQNEVSLNSIDFNEHYSDFTNDLNDSFNDTVELQTQFNVETSSHEKPEYSSPLVKSTSQEENFKRKISYTIGSTAKRELRSSQLFNSEKYKDEEKNLLRKIQHQQRNNENLKIIDIDERDRFKNVGQTNLHSAVIESNLEKVLCLIEGSKRFDLDMFEINTKDDDKKTALDYAIELDLPLLINYLKENNAVQTIKMKK